MAKMGRPVTGCAKKQRITIRVSDELYEKLLNMLLTMMLP